MLGVPKIKAAVITSGSCSFLSPKLPEGTTRKALTTDGDGVVYTRSAFNTCCVTKLCGVRCATSIHAGIPDLPDAEFIFHTVYPHVAQYISTITSPVPTPLKKLMRKRRFLL